MQNIGTERVLSLLVISAWVALLAACNTSIAAIPPATHTPSAIPDLTLMPRIFSDPPPLPQLTKEAIRTEISAFFTYTPADFPALTPGPGIFSGYYINSFEASAFIPCPPDDKKIQGGVSWWLKSSPDSGFWDVAATVVPSLPTQTTNGWKAFVRFEGDVSDLGHYGHLGQYSREITVTHMLEMVAPLQDKDTMCH